MTGKSSVEYNLVKLGHSFYILMLFAANNPSYSLTTSLSSDIKQFDKIFFCRSQMSETQINKGG